MVRKGVVRSFETADGRRVVTIEPAAMRKAIEAAMKTRKTNEAASGPRAGQGDERRK